MSCLRLMKEVIKQEKSVRIFFLPVILISLLTAIDQFTKFVVQSNFELYESKPVIDGVFAFTYIQNRGMAWGMFQGKIPVFLIFTSIFLILAFRIMYNVVDKKRYAMVKYMLVLLISGAIGNLIDRVKLGYVVDFFSFELIDFPVFNVADIYVVISMVSAMILLLFVYSNEEVDEILKIFGKSNEHEVTKEKEKNIEEE
ncbi:MAG: signal peptidase II [Lachnospiraceae bacterium]|nr:signal peptidase II [Lachnospiraceae bacterium]